MLSHLVKFPSYASSDAGKTNKRRAVPGRLFLALQGLSSPRDSVWIKLFCFCYCILIWGIKSVLYLGLYHNIRHNILYLILCHTTRQIKNFCTWYCKILPALSNSFILGPVPYNKKNLTSLSFWKKFSFFFQTYASWNNCWTPICLWNLFKNRVMHQVNLNCLV